MNQKTFNRVIEISKALYDSSKTQRCNHFTFVFFKGKIVSIGRNSKKTHTLNKRNKKISRDGQDITDIAGCCSELNALIKLRNTTNISYNKCVIINTRINNKGVFLLSKPCSSCKNLIKYFRFKQVWFTNNSGQFEQYV